MQRIVVCFHFAETKVLEQQGVTIFMYSAKITNECSYNPHTETLLEVNNHEFDMYFTRHFLDLPQSLLFLHRLPE